jgi:hypothetical protein
MLAKISANLPAILFAIGSALFLAGNVVLVVRGWRA